MRQRLRKGTAQPRQWSQLSFSLPIRFSSCSRTLSDCSWRHTQGHAWVLSCQVRPRTSDRAPKFLSANEVRPIAPSAHFPAQVRENARPLAPLSSCARGMCTSQRLAVVPILTQRRHITAHPLSLTCRLPCSSSCGAIQRPILHCLHRRAARRRSNRFVQTAPAGLSASLSPALIKPAGPISDAAARA